MKKTLLLLCVFVISGAQLYALTPAAPQLTKRQIIDLIKKAQGNIKSVEGMKTAEWANDPDTLEGLEDQLAGQREKLAELQKALLTAK